MKATIQATPTIYLFLTAEIIDMIEVLSRKHYDAVCRRVSLPGGEVDCWRDVLRTWDEKEIRVDFTFREADIIAKVCERSEDAGNKDMCDKFIALLSRSLNEANKISRQEPIELEL
jgi:hypothetical protein